MTQHDDSLDHDLLALLKRVQSLRDQRRLAEALDLCDTLAKDHFSSVVFYARGLVQRDRQDYAASVADFTLAVELDEEDPDYRLERAHSHFMAQQYALATVDYNRAIELSPELASRCIVLRGSCHENMGAIDAALSDYAMAIEINPNHSSGYFRMGRLLSHLGQHEAALRYMNQAIDRSPDDAMAHWTRGIILEDIGEFAQAAEAYSAAISIDSNMRIAHQMLAALLVGCKSPDIRNGPLALMHARRACELSHWEDAFCLDVLASAHAEVGNIDEAIGWQREAIRRSSPEDRADFQATVERMLRRRDSQSEGT